MMRVAAVILGAIALSAPASAQLPLLSYGPGAASSVAVVNNCSGVNGQMDFSNANGCNLFYYVGGVMR